MRREIVIFSVVFGVIVAAFATTVIVLNSSLYSATGFVRGYLGALERHDTVGALETAGELVVPGGASDALLSPEAMGELTDIRAIGEKVLPDGTTVVQFTYSADGTAGQSDFVVTQTDSLFGLFSRWEFAISPLAVVDLSVLHARTFDANGLELIAEQQDEPEPYLVFSPGLYTFSHESEYLVGDPKPILVNEPSSVLPTSLDIRANDDFVAQVQEEINGYLDECTTQEVLMPTGCPFGQEISNRVDSTPQWSMAAYPEVVIESTPTPGQWRMPTTEAAAHLTVDVRSIFDGTISTFDEDVPFTLAYSITFLPDNELLITAQ